MWCEKARKNITNNENKKGTKKKEDCNEWNVRKKTRVQQKKNKTKGKNRLITKKKIKKTED